MTNAKHNSPVSAMPFLAALICFAYYNDSIAQTELFISEVVESTAEKCIEIYNPTSASISLAGTYRIRVGSNGGALTTKSNLTGTISPNATYVICLFSSTFAFDQSMGATGPNGDDAIVLEKNSIAVDIFGNIGCQPSGGGWTQGANSTKSSTLVRTPCTTGIPTDPVSSCPFPTLASEWIQYPEGDLSHLGTHDFNVTSTPLTPLEPICNLADPIDLLTNQNGISGEWSGNGVTNNIFDPDGLFGNISLLFTPLPNQCAPNNSTIIEVINSTTPTLDPLDPICNLADPFDLLTNQNGISGEWSGIGVSNNIFDPDGLSGNISLLFTPLPDQCATNNSTNILVNNSSAPTLDPLDPICNLADPIDLPTNQTGISGAWSGNGVSNNIFDPDGLSGNINLQFNPLSNQCATNNSTTIAVINSTAPSLDPLDPICNLADPIDLPTTQDGINGAWSGDGVSNNIFDPDGLSGSINLQFTPLLNQCATNNSTTIAVINSTTPTLDPRNPICDLADPIDLPTTQDGINGAWSGDGVSNNIFDPDGLSGSINLQFTPLPDQCATNNSITIAVINSTAPSLDPLDPICNLADPISLPTNQNGISGDWSGNGVTNNIFDPDGLSGSINLQFNPLPNQCATNNAVDILVDNSSAPTLDPLDPICNLADPIDLPTTQDGINGEWSGNGVANNIFDPNGLSGSINLLFTPLPDQCATSNSITIEVINSTAPTLDPLDPICNLAEPISLPTNQNLINGAWSGNGVLNNIFDPDGLSGNISLLFTPLPNQCATNNSTTIEVINSTAPTLDPHDPICNLADPISLPTNQNGFSGTWSGNGVTNNIFDPDGLSGNISLLFTPLPDQCARNNSTNILVYNSSAPTLNPLDPICNLADPIDLNTTQDGFMGNWYGQGVNNNFFDPEGLLGNISLLFTPLPDQCAISIDAVIVTIAPPEVTFNSISPVCHGQGNGSIEATTVGNAEPYIFEWDSNQQSNSENGNFISNLIAGTYRVSVTDQNGCESNYTIELTAPEPITIEITPTHETESGKGDGMIATTVQGGEAPFSYLWSNGMATSALSQLTAGLYGLTVTDARGCQGFTSTTINPGACALEMRLDISQPSCYGVGDGAANAIVNNGTDVNFNWSLEGSPSESSIQGLYSGDYGITITDNAGCVISEQFEIHEPDPLLLTLEVTEPSGPAINDASIITITSGGTMPYSYLWSQGTTSEQAGELAPGTYAVSVTDDNGCESISFAEVKEIQCNLQVLISGTSLTCHESNDGKISLVVTGGTGPIVFEWSHANINQEDLDQLEAGTYEVVITDSLGCTLIETAVLSEPPLLKINATSTEYVSASEGYIDLEIIGGTDPYQIRWSTGETSPKIHDLPSGSYAATITDRNGCQVEETFTILKTSCTLKAHAEIKHVSCFGAKDGGVSIMMEGGVTPYVLSWNNKILKDAQVTDLDTGTYEVVVSDAESCMTTVEFQINQPPLLRLTLETEKESAHGQNDAFIVGLGHGGSIPYRYDWSTGATTDSITNLTPGTYMLTISDGNGCISTRSTIINPFQCTLLSNISVRDVQCNGDSLGYARLDVTSEAFPVVTHWSHDPQLNSNYAYNLQPGDYNVTLVDLAGCEHHWPFTVAVEDSFDIQFDVQHQSLSDLDDGQITAQITGGSDQYRLKWSTGDTSNHINHLSPGNYELTISDGFCTYSEDVQILSAEYCHLKVDLILSAYDCENQDGVLEAIVDGHLKQPSYTWSDPTLGISSKAHYSADGRYWVEVTDGNCLASDTIEILGQAIQGLPYQISTSLCSKEAAILKTDTAASSPNQYFLNEIPISLNTQIDLQPGNYIIKRMDPLGCIYEETFEIAEKPELIRESLLHIKRGEEVALVASITQQSYELWYRWESPTGPLCFQCLSYNVSPSETTKYNFSVSDGKECTISETTTVYVDQRELIYLPNAISPNNDGQNDAFVVYDGLELVEEVISLQIYDKRGLRVYRGAHFQSNEEPPEFMNMAQQLIAPQVYMYLLEVQFKEGFKRHYQGSLTIVQ